MIPAIHVAISCTKITTIAKYLAVISFFGLRTVFVSMPGEYIFIPGHVDITISSKCVSDCGIHL